MMMMMGGGGSRGRRRRGKGGLLQRNTRASAGGGDRGGEKREGGWKSLFTPSGRRPVLARKGWKLGGGGGGPGLPLRRAASSRGGAAGAVGPVPPRSEKAQGPGTARGRKSGGRPSCHLPPLPFRPPPPAAEAGLTDKPQRETQWEGDDY